MYKEVQLPSDHPPVNAGKIGVLLVNLGTPSGTDYWSMRRYLKEFLWDKRVIEVFRPLWWFILNVIILTFRPSRSGEAYHKIWNKDKNESPLLTITRLQTEALRKEFSKHPEMIIEFAMRYGNPSIASRIMDLHKSGCERLVVIPLYPQYSAATSATVADEVFRTLMNMRWQPAVRIASPYFDDPVYIDALKSSLLSHLNMLDWEPDHIIASFHGLPKAYFDKGDPYHCHCQKTTRLLKEAMGETGKKLSLTFQSRFGKAEWLQPYTDETLASLPSKGIKKLAVITPGFAADCVETLEEINMQNQEIFRENGGEKFAFIPCLNDSAEGKKLLINIIRRETSGWLTTSS